MLPILHSFKILFSNLIHPFCARCTTCGVKKKGEEMYRPDRCYDCESENPKAVRMPRKCVRVA